MVREPLKHQENVTLGLLGWPSHRLPPSLSGPDDTHDVWWWWCLTVTPSDILATGLFHRLAEWDLDGKSTELNTAYGALILDSDISTDWSGQGRASENIKAFNISYSTYYFSISSWTVQESCRIFALMSAAPEQIKIAFLFFFFSSTLHMHLCGKHSSANGDMCEIQLRTCCGCTLCNPGRLRGSSSQEATLQATSKQKSQWPGPLPGAGHVPSHSPPTLREQLVVTHHHTRSSLISLGLTRYTQVSGKRNPTHIVGHYCL